MFGPLKYRIISAWQHTDHLDSEIELKSVKEVLNQRIESFSMGKRRNVETRAAGSVSGTIPNLECYRVSVI